MGKHKEKTSLSNVQDMIRSFIPDKQPLTHSQLLECRKILNVIKLNEELTAENARLLTKLEILEKSNDKYVETLHLTNGLLSQSNKEKHQYYLIICDITLKLTSIKSKWWYKLMTWGCYRTN